MNLTNEKGGFPLQKDDLDPSVLALFRRHYRTCCLDLETSTSSAWLRQLKLQTRYDFISVRKRMCYVLYFSTQAVSFIVIGNSTVR